MPSPAADLIVLVTIARRRFGAYSYANAMKQGGRSFRYRQAFACAN
jgi:hypothetical protein